MISEAETRKVLIDKKLKDAGWDVHNFRQVSQEFDIPVPLPEGISEPHTPYEGHQFATVNEKVESIKARYTQRPHSGKSLWFS